jgi:acyl-CoA thioester hydrolase
MHLYMEMHVAGPDGYLASTLEQMVMCVDLITRRSTEFPEQVQAGIASLTQTQAGLQRPSNIGRRIGIRR